MIFKRPTAPARKLGLCSYNKIELLMASVDSVMLLLILSFTLVPSVFFPAENLKAMLSSKARSPSSHSQNSDTDSVFPVSPAVPVEPSDSLEVSPEDPRGSEGSWPETFVFQSTTDFQKDNRGDVDLKVRNLLFKMCAVTSPYKQRR